MSALLKKMEEMTIQMDDVKSKLEKLTCLVEKIATGGQVTPEEARKHLTLVKK